MNEELRTKMIGYVLMFVAAGAVLLFFSYPPQESTLLIDDTASQPLAFWPAFFSMLSALAVLSVGGGFFIPLLVLGVQGWRMAQSGERLQLRSCYAGCLAMLGYAMLAHCYQLDLLCCVPGGLLGTAVVSLCFSDSSARGAYVLGALFLYGGLAYCFGKPFFALIARQLHKLLTLINRRMQPLGAAIKVGIGKAGGAGLFALLYIPRLLRRRFTRKGVPAVESQPEPAAPAVERYVPAQVSGGESRSEPLKVKAVPAAAERAVDTSKPYRLPQLSPTAKSEHHGELHAEQKVDAQRKGKLLVERLAQFGIQGTISSITIGPVITLFEFEPAPTVKVSAITSLESDLARALQALSLRIIAPIPGTSFVGFEVANSRRVTVDCTTMLMSKQFQIARKNMHLPLAIAVDTKGAPVVFDMAALPHLLVAGSTGSGKSVGLHAILASLLCSRTPDELRLVLIDPKRLEFTAYADCAHLLVPIITKAPDACAVLKWLVNHMQERYEEMAQAGVRNLAEYRQKGSTLPFIVVVIDELADLMMAAGRDVETALARLAQMARAAGIHLIVATQRPSVDVITGMIKTNFPARIAYKVASKIDSRTIIDEGGADKLLGRGDMLMRDGSGRLVRLHSAYIDDEQVMTITSQIKAQREPVYVDYESRVDDTAAVDEEDRALYKTVIEFLRTINHVSVSQVQRQFRIGYNRASRVMDLLEKQGVVVNVDGAKSRRVVHALLDQVGLDNHTK